MKKILGVIPARIGSQRLKAKPLIDLGGKTLIQRVWEQANKTPELASLVISTDSNEVINLAENFGGKAIITSSRCRSGTDRVAETLELLGESYDLVINIQGDMPFINPDLISFCLKELETCGDPFDMATPAYPIFDEAVYLKPSVVKVVCDTKDFALYFSRASIPFYRTEKQAPLAFKHLGLYIFKPSVLLAFKNLDTGRYEQIEGLEQLRLLENGFKIKIVKVRESLCSPGIEIDTPEDVERALDYINQTRA